MGVLAKLFKKDTATSREGIGQPWLANLKHGKFRPLEEVEQDHAHSLHPYPTEFLLPQIEKHISLREFPFIEKNLENPAFSEEKLRQLIQELGWWEYYFPFSHGLTTRLYSTFNDDTVNFHRFRSQLISETVAELLGEEAASARVLDMACHCGVFSLDLAARGVGHVHGIEYREKNLAQARFLKEYYRIANADFAQGDVYQLSADAQYDVILCLGLLYHVVQPVNVIEYCYHHARQFAVIETVCHKRPISAYMVIGDKDVNVAIEGTRPIELQPTYRGLIDTMRQVGFKEIVEVVGHCDERIDLFSDFTRRCFIGFK